MPKRPKDKIELAFERAGNKLILAMAFTAAVVVILVKTGFFG